MMTPHLSNGFARPHSPNNTHNLHALREKTPEQLLNVNGLPKHPKLILLDRDGVINQDVGSPGVIRKSQFELTPGAGAAIGKLKRGKDVLQDKDKVDGNGNDDPNACRVVIVTNQSCVGKGLLKPNELQKIHDEMESMLLKECRDAFIDQIYICTSVDGQDWRKKPNPGMILEALNDWKVEGTACTTRAGMKNEPSGANPSSHDIVVSAVFIGDTLTDLQAAKAGGLHHCILVETGYGFGLMGCQPASYPPKLIENSDFTSNGMNEDLKQVTPFWYARNLKDAVDFLLGES